MGKGGEVWAWACRRAGGKSRKLMAPTSAPARAAPQRIEYREQLGKAVLVKLADKERARGTKAVPEVRRGGHVAQLSRASQWNAGDA